MHQSLFFHECHLAGIKKLLDRAMLQNIGYDFKVKKVLGNYVIVSDKPILIQFVNEIINSCKKYML